MAPNEAHLMSLKKYCRLCGSGNAIPTDRAPKHKQEYAQWILQAIGIDVAKDDREIHPDFVCHPCFLKLSRWKKSNNKKKVMVLNIKLFEFEAHTTGDCKICKDEPSDEGGPPEYLPTAIQSDILKRSKEFGLVSWMHEKICILVQINKTGTCILKRVVINEQGDCEIFVRGEKLCTEVLQVHGILNKLACDADIVQLLTQTSSFSFCEGNFDIFSDEEFTKFRSENFIATELYKLDGACIKTIFHKNCQKVVKDPQVRCSLCSSRRNDLFAKRSQLRNQKQRVEIESHRRNDLLSSPEKKAKLKLLKRRQKTLQFEVTSLKQKISILFQDEGVVLQSEGNEFMKKVFSSQEKAMQKHLTPASPQYILWEQQRANLLKPSNRWRWHPEIIKWSVALHAKSPAAYNLIRQSGFLSLPSTVSINKYVHFSKAEAGFVPAIVQRVVNEIGAPTGDKRENVTLVLDEMKIKSGLVFSSSSDKLVGFTDTGSLNNMLDDFERRVKDSDDAKSLPLASHVLVLMVRSIFDSYKSPVAYFATRDLTGNDLYPIVWECVRHLELHDIHVRAIVGDGASPNRRLFALHETETSDGIVHFSQNPFREGDRIYFFCDAPHLLKTTRNNWENSGFNQKSRNLKFRGKNISWSHLTALQSWDQQLNAPSPGLRLVHKLTYEHINLTPSLRMRVYLAAQVLSNTVANAIECMGRDEMSSTVYFIRKMNEWFDCMNVTNTLQHTFSRNNRLAPYKSTEDDRFKWLEDDFLGFLHEWHKESEEANDVPKKDRYKLFISKETYTGHQITVKSFVRLAKELLQLPGVDYVLSEKFSQDPLEEYFSKQRGCGGRNENPTLEQFGHNALSLMVAGSKAMRSVKGNCRKRPREDDPVASGAEK